MNRFLKSLIPFILLTIGSYGSADTSNCDLIQNTDQKNYCLVLKKNQKSYCYSILDNDEKIIV